MTSLKPGDVSPSTSTLAKVASTDSRRPALPLFTSTTKFAMVAVATVAILLGQIIFPATAQAQAKDYQIEVVLFENLRPGAAAGATLHVPRLGNSINVTGDKAAELGYALLEEPTMLIDHVDKIKASGQYRLLRHFSWRQPGLDDKEARGIRVYTGRAIKVFIPDNYRQYDRFIPASTGPTFEEGAREISTTTLSGTLKVRLGRFLHLDARLVLTDPETGRSYRLDQSRKMRSRELHYIDNPRFGMLVRIIPLDT